MATAGPSFDALRERADRGDAEAAFQLAAYYGSGQAWQSGIPRDESIAARYYQRACDGGHQQAAWSQCSGVDDSAALASFVAPHDGAPQLNKAIFFSKLDQSNSLE